MKTFKTKRPALWKFKQLDTIRRECIQRAGRLIISQGKLTLSMSADQKNQAQLSRYMDTLSVAT